jgi:hypothetical protein
VAVEGGKPSQELVGQWGQLRLHLGLPGVRQTSARINVSAVDIGFHYPITMVEARREGGEWVNTTGLEAWTTTLELEEDENIIEVRAWDTSGAASVTSSQMILDTMPPSGSVVISKEKLYTNDLNVTLRLEASDKYGIRYVQVSNAPDMFNKVTFPYAESIDWVLEGAEGEVTVFVRFVDAHLLVSEIASDSIIYDPYPPSGEIIINGGDPYTASHTVDLDLLNVFDRYGIARVELSNDANMTDVTVVPADQGAVERWQLAEGGDGPRTVYMRLIDRAGNSAIFSDEIKLYLPKPLGSITIEGGTEITKKTIVELDIEVPLLLRASQMQLSNDAAFLEAQWEAYEKDKLWILSPGDGEKRVFVRFEDFRGIVSLPVNDTIVVDTTPPKVSVSLDGGARYTTDPVVEASIDFEDVHAPTRMWIASRDRFNNVDPQDFEASFNWTVEAREGDHHIYVRVMDQAGNVAGANATIHFATVHPEIQASLPDGTISNSTDRIRIAVEPTDPYGGIEVQIAFDEEPAKDAPWHQLNDTLWAPIADGSGDGSHVVTVRARNAAGLLSDVVSIDVRLDRTPPQLSIEAPYAGQVISQQGLDILLRVAASDASGIAGLRYRTGTGQWVDFPVGATTTTVTLEDHGDQFLEVLALDGGGNTAVASTDFRLESSGSKVAGGRGVLALVLIVVLVVLGGLVYNLWWRNRRADTGGPPVASSVQAQPPDHGAPGLPEVEVFHRPVAPEEEQRSLEESKGDTMEWKEM